MAADGIDTDEWNATPSGARSSTHTLLGRELAVLSRARPRCQHGQLSEDVCSAPSSSQKREEEVRSEQGQAGNNTGRMSCEQETSLHSGCCTQLASPHHKRIGPDKETGRLEHPPEEATQIRAISLWKGEKQEAPTGLSPPS